MHHRAVATPVAMQFGKFHFADEEIRFAANQIVGMGLGFFVSDEL